MVFFLTYRQGGFDRFVFSHVCIFHFYQILLLLYILRTSFIINQKYFVPTVLASVASTTDATKGKTIAPKVYAETHLP